MQEKLDGKLYRYKNFLVYFDEGAKEYASVYIDEGLKGLTGDNERVASCKKFPGLNEEAIIFYDSQVGKISIYTKNPNTEFGYEPLTGIDFLSMGEEEFGKVQSAIKSGEVNDLTDTMGLEYEKHFNSMPICLYDGNAVFYYNEDKPSSGYLLLPKPPEGYSFRLQLRQGGNKVSQINYDGKFLDIYPTDGGTMRSLSTYYLKELNESEASSIVAESYYIESALNSVKIVDGEGVEVTHPSADKVLKERVDKFQDLSRISVISNTKDRINFEYRPPQGLVAYFIFDKSKAKQQYNLQGEKITVFYDNKSNKAKISYNASIINETEKTKRKKKIIEVDLDHLSVSRFIPDDEIISDSGLYSDEENDKENDGGQKTQRRDGSSKISFGGSIDEGIEGLNSSSSQQVKKGSAELPKKSDVSIKEHLDQIKKGPKELPKKSSVSIRERLDQIKKESQHAKKMSKSTIFQQEVKKAHRGYQDTIKVSKRLSSHVEASVYDNNSFLLSYNKYVDGELFKRRPFHIKKSDKLTLYILDDNTHIVYFPRGVGNIDESLMVFNPQKKGSAEILPIDNKKLKKVEGLSKPISLREHQMKKAGGKEYIEMLRQAKKKTEVGHGI